MNIVLRKAVRDGVITPEQAEQIALLEAADQAQKGPSKPKRLPWWQVLLSGLFMAICVTAVILVPIALVFWAVRTIAGL